MTLEYTLNKKVKGMENLKISYLLLQLQENEYKNLSKKGKKQFEKMSLLICKMNKDRIIKQWETIK